MAAVASSGGDENEKMEAEKSGGDENEKIEAEKSGWSFAEQREEMEKWRNLEQCAELLCSLKPGAMCRAIVLIKTYKMH